MMIRARRFEFMPDSVAIEGVHEVELATAAQVEEFVAALASHEPGEAALIHTTRPSKRHPLTGKMVPDHRLQVAVSSGYGYAEFTGEGRWCQLAGDPASPEYHTSSSDTMRAGTGVSLQQLADVISEFLAKAELPRTVRWIDQTSTHGLPTGRSRRRSP